MRKVGLTLVLFLAACGGGSVFSPSDPKTFDRGMFDAQAVNALPKEERAYVMGHAIGVYLYGKTLPKYVGHHYYYRPGKSSPHAEGAYQWEDLLLARSGGSDGQGGAIYDDVSGAEPGHDGTNDNTEPDGTPPGEPSDDVGEGDGGDCGGIAAECGVFLDPAAVDARALALEVDASRFAPDGLSEPELADFSDEFRRGLASALAMIDAGELADESEVTYTKEAAIIYGICER